MIIGLIVQHAWRIRETDVEFFITKFEGQRDGANMWSSYTVLLCWERPTSEVLKVICSGSMKLLELAADRYAYEGQGIPLPAQERWTPPRSCWNVLLFI